LSKRISGIHDDLDRIKIGLRLLIFYGKLDGVRARLFKILLDGFSLIDLYLVAILIKDFPGVEPELRQDRI